LSHDVLLGKGDNAGTTFGGTAPLKFGIATGNQFRRVRIACTLFTL